MGGGDLSTLIKKRAQNSMHFTEAQVCGHPLYSRCTAGGPLKGAGIRLPSVCHRGLVAAGLAQHALR